MFNLEDNFNNIKKEALSKGFIAEKAEQHIDFLNSAYTNTENSNIKKELQKQIKAVEELAPHAQLSKLVLITRLH